MLTPILSLLVTLSVLILIHEWGHFAAAKWVGIQVPRFSLGLGPKVWGFRRGETEYVLSAIPLGGYVKMAGMEDDEAQSTLEGGAEGVPVDPDRTFDSKPLWARTLVISAGVLMNLLFAVVVFAILAAFYGEAVVRSTRVAPRPDATNPVAQQVAQIPYGASIAAVGDRPVATYGELVEAVTRGPAGATTLRLGDGSAVPLTIPADSDDRIALMRALPLLVPATIGTVVPGEPADRAGLRRGDQVLEVNGEAIPDWNAFVRVIEQRPGVEMTLVVARDGVRQTVQVTPRAASDGARGEVGRIGVGAGDLPIERRRLGPLGAVRYGFTETWRVTAEIGNVLVNLITGRMSTRNLGGLIAIGEASGESARLGLEYFLGFLALFSVNLAVLNLLPIPILDGGHLMFLAAEALRGRPLSVETRVRLSQVGLLVVVALMLLANGNDVVRVVQRWLGG